MPILGISASGGLAPGAPTIGTATAGDTSATVAYTAPTWPGKGSGAVTYTATSSPGGFTGTGSSPITVSGLTNGTAYTFTVKATTSYGVTGPASASSNSITPAASGSFESIATATLSSPATTISLSGISQSYQHLLIRYWTTPTGSGETNTNMRWNGSTSAIYNTMEAISDGSSQASLGWLADTKFNIGYTYGTFSTGAPQIANFLIPNYASTTKYKTGVGWWGTTGPTVGGATNMAMSFGSTAAITQVEILTTGNNLGTGSKLQIYGIKGS